MGPVRSDSPLTPRAYARFLASNLVELTKTGHRISHASDSLARLASDAKNSLIARVSALSSHR